MNEKQLIADAVWSYDPIGVKHYRDEIPDEYDEVIRGLLVFYKMRAGAERMQEWIHRFFATSWGVELSHEASRDLVRSVIAALDQK